MIEHFKKQIYDHIPNKNKSLKITNLDGNNISITVNQGRNRWHY